MLEVKRNKLKKFENKSILIWGFGKEGQSTLAFLKEKVENCKITILDDRVIECEDSSVNVLQSTDFNHYDWIFKSPGIVISTNDFPFSKLVSQTSVFVDVFKERIIGITGTKGKSTTSTLMAHVLKEGNKKVVLVGNIGVPCFDVWDQMDKDTWAVFEMSCHQLEFIQSSPHISVLLNLYPEHLDHYENFDAYCDAKKNIFRYQSKEDYLFIDFQHTPTQGNQKIVECSLEEDADIFPVGETCAMVMGEEIEFPKSSLIGKHNHYNAAIVYAISRQIGISKDVFMRAYQTFKPLAHRLESIGVIQGIHFIDDSISTIPQSTIEAIKSLKEVDSVLIGGMDRGIDYSQLIQFLIESDVSVIILMYESGKRIAKEWIEGKKQFFCVKDLNEAVHVAKLKTKKGKICLLSPAAASYGDFKNFEQRGDKFKELVREND